MCKDNPLSHVNVMVYIEAISKQDIQSFIVHVNHQQRDF